MVVQCFLRDSIRINFTTDSAGVREVKSLEQHMKCWSSTKGFDFGCHALRVRLGLRAFGLSPNVFMLALAFSPKWVPDVFFSCLFFGFFFVFFPDRGPETRWLCRSSCRYEKPPHKKNWHHLMSHRISSKRNYIHLNLSNTSPKERQKSVYLQFIAKCKPQRQKWDMCKLLWIHSILSDESRMYRVGREREERHNLCPAYLYDTRLWKGKKKIKGKLLRTKCELCCHLFISRHCVIIVFQAIKCSALYYYITGDHRKVRRQAQWIKAACRKKFGAADRVQRGQIALACHAYSSHACEYGAISLNTSLESYG